MIAEPTTKSYFDLGDVQSVENVFPDILRKRKTDVP